MSTATEIAPARPDPFAELSKRKRPWWILWTVVVVALVAAGVIAIRRRNRPQPVKYVTSHVTVGTIVETIEATGTVQPVLQVQVGSQVSGRVAHVAVDYNSRVHRGDLLAQIDQQPFRLQKNSAQAQLLSAQATAARARVDFDLQERNLARAIDLQNRHLNAPQDVDAARAVRDQSRAQVAIANAQVAASRAQLDQAQTNLDFTRISAPIDGIVITRSVDEGQTVAASFQTPTLFVIANDLTQMRVIADVDEADIGKLHEGLVSDARVDAFPGDDFRGTVRELRFGSTTTSGVVTYPAVIDIANPEIKLRPGMTATITVTTQRHEDILRVPNAALRYHPSNASGGNTTGNGGGGGGSAGGGDAGTHAHRSGGGNGGGSGSAGNSRADRSRIYVLRNGEPHMVRVRTGLSDGTFTEVTADELHDGDEVVTDETDAAAAPGTGAGAGGGAPGGGGAARTPQRGPRMF